jgi:pyrrolidone-carboxylate peptidase
MKLAIFIFLFSTSLWARPIILLGYFDPFGKAPFNNSERVANLLYEKVKNNPHYDLRLCKLETVFDKSFYELEDCLKALPEAPKLVLGLGESNCNFKTETMGRNNDRTFGPDNDGVSRSNTRILQNGPNEIGLNYPLEEMYCSLPAKDRGLVEVSNNAGSFVCNNLAYQFAEKYQDEVFGFIHVPTHNCKNLDVKTEFSVRSLETMLKTAALSNTEVKKLSTKKREIEILRAVKTDTCSKEFYNRTKGIDEKSRWPF